MRKWITRGLAVLLLLGSLVACAAEDTSEGAYLLYVPANGDSAAGADAIAAIHTNLNVEDTAVLEGKAAAVVEEILARGGRRWSKISLQAVSAKNHRIYVDLSEEYTGLTGIHLSLLDYCITLSLAQLDGVASVTITADGRELPYRDSQVLMEQDVLLSTMDDVIETVRVSLFFVDKNGVIAEEIRLLELYEGQTLAESTIEALLDGPQEQELNAVIPEEFKISSIRIEDRVCTLSLPGTSLEVLPEGEYLQRTVLQSIAKTVYSREGVDELRIMVDGVLCTDFGAIPTSEVQFRPTEP